MRTSDNEGKDRSLVLHRSEPPLIVIAINWISTIGGAGPDCISHEIRSEFKCKWWFPLTNNEIGFDPLLIWN
jgi:hypothetical protein